MSRKLILGLIFSALLITAFGQPSMPRIFADGMILQRNEPVKFWGEAEPGQQVTVELDGFASTTLADQEGRWELLYPAHLAGGPFVITVTGSVGSRTFQDVWFGDVWVASGQSNMEWKINWGINDKKNEIADSDYPQIRFFEVPNETEVAPAQDLSSGQWIQANKATVGEFSAVAWFFAKLNHLEKGVPVGIIDCNWGGTPAEAWTSPAALSAVPGYQDVANEMLDPRIDWQARMLENQNLEKYKYELIEDKTSFYSIGAHLPDYDDADWEDVTLPTTEPLHDFVWLRKTFEWKGQRAAKLYLGDIVQLCHVFFNGELVAEESWMDSTDIVEISSELIKKGTNTIAIRAINDWDNRVSVGRANQMWLKDANRSVSLEGTWKFNNELEPKMPEVERFSWKPGVLFNGMIKPIAGYTISGTIWYQGESNAGLAKYYHQLFSTMIQDWRIYWQQGNFPFLFVQLANFMETKTDPAESDWAELREAQTQTLALPNTGMATIIDIGEADDIHPRNKQDVGKRLWLAAKKVVFGEDLVYSGPMYQSIDIEGSQVRVSFDHVGSGLVVKGEKLKGFEMAGPDGVFKWAEAKIIEDQIVLNHPDIQEPTAIRYAWADNPDCNLYNEEGLPAVPFRTDQ